MDTITLSTAQLVNSDQLLPEIGWKLILIAALANLVFKVGAMLVLGHRQLLARVGMLYGLALVGGVLLLWTGEEAHEGGDSSQPAAARSQPFSARRCI